MKKDNPGSASEDDRSEPHRKKSFLRFSLRTHLPADAKILARRLTEMSDLVFAADPARVGKVLRDSATFSLRSILLRIGMRHRSAGTARD
ncbi:hypothetical protein GCM10011392_18660 [Wenxinia marina]|uniref:Uncharacterized protein n=2 Tax=Wenxinia TaxID=653686 RepID=A0A0D0PBS3_9RHOB|nr:hypothetical protein [Wenxinia marina]KIQ68906.1 hypothetical protein Wenmar_02637 [Wenxinia marina DSM 24838]GGL64289.1 hypothetical protein GCM10011392_18660 [Wenxinia marina]